MPPHGGAAHGTTAGKAGPEPPQPYGTLAIMNVREIMRLLRDDGWYQVAMRGSHRQLKHPSKPGRVTVAGKPRDDLATGTRDSILKQAGLKK